MRRQKTKTKIILNRRYKKIKRLLKKKKVRSYLWGLGAVLMTWGVYFLYLWPKMLFWSAKGIMAGWIGLWGDWAAHLSYASVFAYRPITNWFTAHPLYWDHKFTYPFAADAISGLLMRLGVDVVPAFVVPSIITTLFLLIALYAFYYFILKS